LLSLPASLTLYIISSDLQELSRINFDNKGVQKFDPPGEEAEGNDWVLVLEGV